MSQSQLRATLIAAFALAALLSLPTTVFGQSPTPTPYLIDTGQGANSSIGAPALFASGSTTCSPQPSCAQAFQFLGFQITLTQAAAINSLEIWVAFGNRGGSMDVKIRENVNGLPSTNAPPLFSPNSIYSKRYDNLPSFGSARWVRFQQYEAVLAAGTYWITFEPVHASGLNYSMGGQVPAPLVKYAFYGNGNPGYLALSPATNLNHRLGFRLAGANFPGIAFGTATRTILKAKSFGYFYDYDFIREGTRDFTRVGAAEGPALTSSYIFVLGSGHVHGNGRITEKGPRTGAYAFTSGGCLPTYDCNHQGIGAGRGVAYQTVMNMSNVPRTFKVNALLHGGASSWPGKAFAALYVFNSATFSDTIASSGLTPAEFLLRRDGLQELSASDNAPDYLSLAKLFPQGALLASTSQNLTAPLGSEVLIPLSTGLVTLDPQESVTIMFDIAAYAPEAGAINFGDTLSPAANLITDDLGNPVYDLVIVGPSAAPPPAAASLTLAPASATAGVGTPHSLTATVKAANGKPVSDAAVTFSVTSGPHAGLTQQVKTDTDGEATLTYIGDALGTDSIQASTAALQSDVVTTTWTVGPPHHIVVSPASATINAGGSQAYTVEAFDAINDSLGDVTNSTVFSILPDGSCAGASCTATVAGAHTVTASYNGISAAATLTVNAASVYSFEGFFQPIDMSPPGSVVWNTVRAGSAVPAKWRLTAGGAPVSDPTSFAGLSSYPADCGSGAGSTESAIEELAPGDSGLTYNGGGNWQYNWKTPTSYEGTCRVLVVRFKDGSTSPGANFKFH